LKRCGEQIKAAWLNHQTDTKPFWICFSDFTMSFVQTIYNGIFRRTSTFALACVASAFIFERGFDVTAEAIFENMNRGVRRYFKTNEFNPLLAPYKLLSN